MNGILLLLIMLHSVAPSSVAEPAIETEIVEEQPDPVTGEFPVDPYIQSNENAGAKPFQTQSMAEQFGGQTGIRKVTDRLVDLSIEDPRISEIFKGQDLIRLRRTLFEQFCGIAVNVLKCVLKVPIFVNVPRTKWFGKQTTGSTI